MIEKISPLVKKCYNNYTFDITLKVSVLAN